MTPEHAKAARELLCFYAEAGVDGVLGEDAKDWLSAEEPALDPIPDEAPGKSISAAAQPQARAPSGRAPSVAPIGQPPRPARPAPPPPDTAVMSAREAARSAASLDELRGILDRFEGCGLKASASRLVFADGNPESRLMFIGEAPGAEEDRQGLPFVGRSGQLLDHMLAAIGLDRTKVYIANIVPWRPPGNRTPTPVETQICLPFIQRQIELVDPDVLVTVGQPSSGALLGVQGIMKNRGRWFPYQTGTREIRAMPMLHPAYLLRSPIGKRLAWRDLLAIKKALG
ncbi:MAG: uracil-DNA glycosylase [Rhizobiales bacterium]|jgi:DNA polymerase|nr:uracil-DNA glycosylase [Hyphomicrobiales bacterium]